MKSVTVIDTVHLYYTVMSNVIRFKVKVVFVIRMFFIISYYGIALKFSDSSISESSSGSMSDTFKSIDVKAFSKLINNSICSTITTLRSIFAILIFF